MREVFHHLMVNRLAPPGVLPDIERDFEINDEKSGLLQTGERVNHVITASQQSCPLVAGC